MRNACHEWYACMYTSNLYHLQVFLLIRIMCGEFEVGSVYIHLVCAVCCRADVAAWLKVLCDLLSVEYRREKVRIFSYTLAVMDAY